mmetsp:Transcript_8252/g.23534  ORF Transcript_8252/g.23534 Transcript_8252/m.23534 type:complete len:104 (-) Transcript_8252:32-343(-)
MCHTIRGAPPFFVELLDPAVNKGEGVRRLVAELGLDLARCVAFGDGDNDLEMIKIVGHGVAMANARDLIKDSADSVTPKTNAEDGVSDYLENMLLKNKFAVGA